MARRPLESSFQKKLKAELKQLFPGCLILKNDPNFMQGIPDLVIFWRDRYAFLECKKSAHEASRPNQAHYVAYLDQMSFAAFIYPENKEAVLDALQRSFTARR